MRRPISDVVEARPSRIGIQRFETDLIEDQVGSEIHRRPADRRCRDRASPFHPHLTPRPVPRCVAVDLVGRTVEHQFSCHVHELLTATGVSRQIVVILLPRHDMPTRQQRRDGFGAQVERGSTVGGCIGQASGATGFDEFDRQPVVGGDGVVRDLGPRHGDLVVEVGHVGVLDVVVAFEDADTALTQREGRLIPDVDEGADGSLGYREPEVVGVDEMWIPGFAVGG